ncbi:unnamed protein product [Adineta steineri]|uniref:Glucose-methanol-choline oxidoreductase N-terminal domain-containing protein n=1 Tax=Adineta steineri TaxID=433720 RepID=A0A819KXE4_9BILA|nr:unnamed protein product [Adineta steineri]CAF3952032.1 unnamed protein product [Adineta steineri]
MDEPLIKDNTHKKTKKLLKIIVALVVLVLLLVIIILALEIRSLVVLKETKNDITPAATEEYDFIVVGLGAGGSVIASRLSEIPHVTVLGIDGGPHEVDADEDPNDSEFPYSFISPHDPSVVSLPLKAGKNKIMYIPRFNGLGGTLRLYGGINVRPSRAILERWPENWRYDDLLPYYKRIEDHYCYYYPSHETGISDQDCKKYHGKDGPLQVNPTYVPEFANISKTFESICKDSTQMWHGYNSDLNGANNLGCALFQRYLNRKGDRTDVQSDYYLGTSFHGYLNSSVCKRTNLRIRPATSVIKILFDTSCTPPKATGVVIQNGTGVYTIKVKKELILAGGAFATPHLLQISGVGDPVHLQSINILQIATNYHIGRNLRDHVAIPIIFQVKDKYSTYPNHENATTPPQYRKSIPNGSKSWIIALNTGLRNDNITDLQIYFSDTNYHSPDGFMNTNPRKCRFGSNGHKEEPLAEITLRMILQDPSFSGTVMATTGNIANKPMVDFKWEKISDYEYGVFSVTVDAIRKLLHTTEWGDLIADELFPGNDTTIEEFINNHLESALHPISTCQLGLCCDENLLVYNISNVRVCDASAFGEQVDANPTATIFALAEKLSDIIRKEYGYVSYSKNHNLLTKEKSRVLAPGETIPSDTIHKLKDYSQIFPQAA